ncbi:MAG: hypothetical protein M3367_17145 [Acidobacteriota bacterium]|nr:hypothetical protein [Acidobacteriota bacterium]
MTKQGNQNAKIDAWTLFPNTKASASVTQNTTFVSSNALQKMRQQNRSQNDKK